MGMSLALWEGTEHPGQGFEEDCATRSVSDERVRIHGIMPASDDASPSKRQISEIYKQIIITILSNENCRRLECRPRFLNRGRGRILRQIPETIILIDGAGMGKQIR
jgi:hypothetical protein